MAKNDENTPLNIDELKNRPLGRVLVKMGKVTRAQVHEGLAYQKDNGGPIGQILVDLGFVDEGAVKLAMAFQAGMEYVDLDDLHVDDEVVRSVPPQMAKAYSIIPLEYDEASKHLTVALGSPDNFRALDDLQMLMGYRVTAKIADEDKLDTAIKKFYESSTESFTDLINEMAEEVDVQFMSDRSESIDEEMLREQADSNSVKRLVNMVLLEAIRARASDIHFEPFEDEFHMRYRIDGLLYDMIPPPKPLAVAIASRIKVMANLNIAERRLPQDGRIELIIDSAPVDLRISVLPTMFGESVVMRVLDRSNISLDVEKIGMREDDLHLFRQLIHRPNGIVIVTGPTGSGKTTTLYSALNELNDESVKILTAEDPVEYDIDGLVQVQINEDIGLTFASALRSFLRQDPDTILVGEVRDLETAQIAVQASLTGHLVFTTLHTNDAPSAIARLLDLGLEPFLITATLEAIVAQRLVRTICPRCREEFVPTADMLMELGLMPEDVEGRSFYHGKGCDFCRGTGYSGREAIFEIMTIDDELRLLITQRKSTGAIREAARKRGMRSLRDSGLLSIFDGRTTIEEVVAQTIMEDMD